MLSFIWRSLYRFTLRKPHAFICFHHKKKKKKGTVFEPRHLHSLTLTFPVPRNTTWSTSEGDFLIHDKKTKHFFYFVLKTTNLTWLSLLYHQLAQARQNQYIVDSLPLGHIIYNWHYSAGFFYVTWKIAHLYLCRRSWLGPREDPHGLNAFSRGRHP